MGKSVCSFAADILCAIRKILTKTSNCRNKFHVVPVPPPLSQERPPTSGRLVQGLPGVPATSLSLRSRNGGIDPVRRISVRRRPRRSASTNYGWNLSGYRADLRPSLRNWIFSSPLKGSLGIPYGHDLHWLERLHNSVLSPSPDLLD